MRQAPHAAALTVRGIPFAYSKPYKSFFCDTKTLLYVLHKHYPDTCSEMTKKYPELEKALDEIRNPKAKRQFDSEFLDKTWRKVIGHEEAAIQAPEPVVEEIKEENKEVQAKPAQKPGMISRISKNIKKIIAKLTPKKLRKRLNMEEEEGVDKPGTQ